MELTRRNIVITGTSPILGSQSPNPDMRSAYIASKAPDRATAISEEGLLDAETLNEKSLTVFLRNPSTGGLMLLDYQLRGFIKEALNTLSAQLGLVQAKSKVDKYLFVAPRHVAILRPDDSLVTEPDGIYERPLRAMTMQGPRVTLIGSEQVDEWMIRVQLVLFDNDGSKKSVPLQWAEVDEALDYGQWQGLGQFRNGSFGRFTWKEVKA